MRSNARPVHRWKDRIAAGALSRDAASQAAQLEAFPSAPAAGREELRREKWRRVSGITRRIETHLDPRERRAHIARLAGWIEGRVERDALLTVRAPKPAAAGAGGAGDAIVSSTQNAASKIQNGPAAIGCTTEWLPPLPHWRCLQNGVLSVEALCAELGLPRRRLTQLLREYCGLSAGEFVDGLRLRKLKHALLPQLRAAARALWGRPGQQAELLAGGETPAATWRPKKDSKFFSLQPEDWRDVDAWRCNISARASALLEKLRELRSDGGGPCGSGGGGGLDDLNGNSDLNGNGDLIGNGGLSGSNSLSGNDGLSGSNGLSGNGNGSAAVSSEAASAGSGLTLEAEDFDLNRVVLELGFASLKRLNEACLRVFGRSLKRIERMLCEEIARYYIAAEERCLREIALRGGQSAWVARARHHYHGDDERAPAEPFLDKWSAAETFQKEWLEAMAAAFG